MIIQMKIYYTFLYIIIIKFLNSFVLYIDDYKKKV